MTQPLDRPPVDPALAQLASMKSSEYLSTQQDASSRPIFGGALFINQTFWSRILPASLRWNSIRSEKEEESIKAVIQRSLQNFVESEEPLPQKTAPILSSVEIQLKKQNLLSGLICETIEQLWNKILPPPPSANQRSEIAQSLFEEDEIPQEHPTPTPPPPVSELVQDQSSTSSSPLLEASQLHDVTQEPSTSSSSQSITPTLWPPSPALQQEIAHGLSVANTQWFLHTRPTEEELHLCQQAALALLDKAQTNERLSNDDWEQAARAFVTLLTAPELTGYPNLLQHSSDLFFRYYVSHGCPNSVPPEYAALFDLIEKNEEVRARYTFFRSMPPLMFSEEDPNAAQALAGLEDEYQATRWQTCDLSLQGMFPTDTPWPSRKTDIEGIHSLLTKLNGISPAPEVLIQKEHLRGLCVALLFIVSSHSLHDQEWAECKKLFLKLEPSINQLMEYIRKNPPHPQEERRLYNDFRKLYFFLKESGFKERMLNERAEGKNFSIWEYIPGTKDLAGNTSTTFTIGDLTKAITDARAAAVFGTRHKITTPLHLNSTHPSENTPPPPLSLPWSSIFFEATDRDMTISWAERQKEAREGTERIAAAFSHCRPSLHFDVLVRAIQRNDPAVDAYLATMPDKGLSLLREYVYPYCVLNKLASTESSSPAAKFIGGAASADEVCSLGGAEIATQVAILKNVIHIMRPSEGTSQGGILSNSAIHSSQIGMLRTITTCLETRKQVFLCNETGSGKTTMAKLAPEIVSLEVPLVLHVAPFTQSGKEWKPLTTWNDLTSLPSGQTLHLWITATDIRRLMSERKIPEQAQKTLQQSLLLMDEYDNEMYRFETPAPDGKSAPLMTSIQDELVFSYGCQRICNMSATPNLETFQNRIERYHHKLEDLTELSETEQKKTAPYYEQKIHEIESRRDELSRTMAREWGRSMQIKDLHSSTDPTQQIAQVFLDLPASLPTQGDRSVLVEMPRFVLSEPFIETLHAHMEKTFPGMPSAVLFRDSKGEVQAHLNTKPWKIVSFEEFKRLYPSINPKPPVVCFYSQDSVGGDFEIFSNERYVRSQFIVYPGTIAPSYAIFQNMRRQRVNRGSPKPGEPFSPSKTPITLYLGEKASASLSPTTDEAEKISSLSPEERTSALDMLRKEKLLRQADRTGLYVSQQMEASRLKLKLIRKKQQVLTQVLEIDKRALTDVLTKKELLFSTIPIETAKEQLNQLFNEARATCTVGLDEAIETARKRILLDVLNNLSIPETSPDFALAARQKGEVYRGLRELFLGTPPTQPTTDPWEHLKKQINPLFAPGGRDTISWNEVLGPKFMQQARKKNDPQLHPIPSSASIEEALMAARPKTEGPQPPPSTPMKIRRLPGIKPIVSDDMMKILVGSTIKDSLKAKKYLENIERFARQADERYGTAYLAYKQELAKQTERLKLKLREQVLAIGTDQTSLLPLKHVQKADQATAIGIKKAEEYKEKLGSYSRAISPPR